MSDNNDQAAFWAGQTAWAREQRALDAVMAPALGLVLERADLQAGQRVLDIGCGTGASLLAAAKAVGPQGRVTGVDISPSLLAEARNRCTGMTQIDILQADAQSAPLPGGHDAMISRFGVMFFADTPRAFANIAGALKPGARLTMAAWAAVQDNPWFLIPGQIARARLGEVAQSDPSLPGPFAFANADRVRQDLAAADLHDVRVEETHCALTPEGGLDTFAELCLQVGPAVRVMRDLDASAIDRQAIADDIKAQFSAFETDQGLRIPASMNMITARVRTGG